MWNMQPWTRWSGWRAAQAARIALHLQESFTKSFSSLSSSSSSYSHLEVHHDVEGRRPRESFRLVDQLIGFFIHLSRAPRHQDVEYGRPKGVWGFKKLNQDGGKLNSTSNMSLHDQELSEVSGYYLKMKVYKRNYVNKWITLKVASTPILEMVESPSSALLVSHWRTQGLKRCFLNNFW